jgi:hypothetical protein
MVPSFFGHRRRLAFFYVLLLVSNESHEVARKIQMGKSRDGEVPSKNGAECTKQRTRDSLLIQKRMGHDPIGPDHMMPMEAWDLEHPVFDLADDDPHPISPENAVANAMAEDAEQNASSNIDDAELQNMINMTTSKLNAFLQLNSNSGSAREPFHLPTLQCEIALENMFHGRWPSKQVLRRMCETEIGGSDCDAIIGKIREEGHAPFDIGETYAEKICNAARRVTRQHEGASLISLHRALHVRRHTVTGRVVNLDAASARFERTLMSKVGEDEFAGTVKDTRAGCPSSSDDSALISQWVYMKEAGPAFAVGSIIRHAAGYRQLMLKINDDIVRRSLTYTAIAKYKGMDVFWAGELAKGWTHVSLSGSPGSGFGCGEEWGAVSVIKSRDAKVTAISQLDSRSGCPARNHGANVPIIQKQVSTASSGHVFVAGSIIGHSGGRSDLHLMIDGAHVRSSLGGGTGQWEGQDIFYAAPLSAGAHTIAIQSPHQGAFGCGASWGSLNILMSESPTFTTFSKDDGRAGCPDRSWPASHPLVSKDLYFPSDGWAFISGKIISNSPGRTDIYLDVDGNMENRGLTSTPNQWENLEVFFRKEIHEGLPHGQFDTSNSRQLRLRQCVGRALNYAVRARFNLRAATPPYAAMPPRRHPRCERFTSLLELWCLPHRSWWISMFMSANTHWSHV